MQSAANLYVIVALSTGRTVRVDIGTAVAAAAATPRSARLGLICFDALQNENSSLLHEFLIPDIV